MAFLQHTGEAENKQMPRDYGVGLFTSGVGGAALIFGFLLAGLAAPEKTIGQPIDL